MNEQIEQGVSRTAELENLLGEILDTWNQNELVEVDADGLAVLTESGQDLFDRIGATLEGDEDELGFS